MDGWVSVPHATRNVCMRLTLILSKTFPGTIGYATSTALAPGGREYYWHLLKFNSRLENHLNQRNNAISNSYHYHSEFLHPNMFTIISSWHNVFSSIYSIPRFIHNVDSTRELKINQNQNIIGQPPARPAPAAHSAAVQRYKLSLD